MTTTPHLLAIHQQLLDLSQEMRRLAAAGEWDELIQKEVNYVSTVQQMAQSTGSATVSGQMQSMLQRLLRQILDNECEVRRLLQARMNELSSLVNQSSRQKSVLSAYGNSGTVLVPQDKGCFQPLFVCAPRPEICFSDAAALRTTRRRCPLLSPPDA